MVKVSCPSLYVIIVVLERSGKHFIVTKITNVFNHVMPGFKTPRISSRET